MPNQITLSDRTRDLIVQMGVATPHGLSEDAERIDRGNLLVILNNLNSKGHPHRFLVESLRASLLRDLRCSLLGKEEDEIHPPKKARFFSQLKFWALVVGGTFLAICEGYDGIISLLPLVTIPVWVGQFALGVFSILSVVAFYAFDLDQVSENLGVKLPEARRLLDVLLDQSKDVNLIRKILKKLTTTNVEELNYASRLVEMLTHTQAELNTMQAEFNEGFNNRYLNAAKIVATVVTGLIYFSGGFFVSQIPVASFFSVIGLSIAATAWPVFLASTAIGMAAFGVYWYVQRPGVDHFVANLFGLDKKKIDALDNRKTDVLSGEEASGMDRLQCLKETIDSKRVACWTEIAIELEEPIIKPFLQAPRNDAVAEQNDSLVDGIASVL